MAAVKRNIGAVRAAERKAGRPVLVIDGADGVRFYVRRLPGTSDMRGYRVHFTGRTGARRLGDFGPWPMYRSEIAKLVRASGGGVIAGRVSRAGAAL